jgi:hypothetical protein
MPDADEQERREDLAATSESLQNDAERIVDIEDEKQKLDLDDPRVTTLSKEAERLSLGVVQKSRVERDLSEGDGDGPPERSN